MNTNRIVEIGQLVGERARAAMLSELLDGRALTATELARAATITPQTASAHLSRLASAGLLDVHQRGRQRYHRLSGPHVARMLEEIMQVASANEPRKRALLIVGPKDAAMRAARTCYDHLAGQLGVAIADRLVALGAVEFEDDAGLVTEEGVHLLGRIGIVLPEGRSSRPLCRPCLDWSERRPHVGGRLGAAICAHSLEKGWTRRRKGTRALEVTPKGRAALRNTLGIFATTTSG